MKHLWHTKISGTHFFPTKVYKLKITQKRAKKRVSPLGSLPYSQNKKQQKKRQTYSQTNEPKKKKARDSSSGLNLSRRRRNWKHFASTVERIPDVHSNKNLSGWTQNEGKGNTNRWTVLLTPSPLISALLSSYTPWPRTWKKEGLKRRRRRRQQHWEVQSNALRYEAANQA